MPWLPVTSEEPRIEKRPSPPVVQHQHAARTTQTFGELVVRAESSQYDAVTNVFRFDKGVTAAYGVTQLQCDHLEVDMNTQRAIAKGNVIVTDPEASLSTENLTFSWQAGARFGHAENVRIQVGHVIIVAKSADLSDAQWVLIDVALTQCPDIYWLHSPRVVITPGERASMTKPQVRLFGRRIITLPNQSYNLNPRTQGIGWPSISYSGGTNIGIDWDAGWLINDRTNVLATANASRGSYPGYGVVITHSVVKEPGANSIVTPPSELGERFRYGYFDNIQVATPQDEIQNLQSDRNSISLSSLWNQYIFGRESDDIAVSKPYELVYERGGKVGTLGLLGQARVQRIYEVDGKSDTRAVVGGTVSFPSVPLAPRVGSLARLDMMQFLGTESYGWARAQVGAAYEMNPQVRLAGALIGTVDYGSPMFRFDEPVERNGLNLRADFNLGPTKLSIIQKYDTKLAWYDRELSLSQIAGCFEPYLIQRQFPRSFVLGVRLRTGDFEALIHRTGANRPADTTTVISSDKHP